MTQGRQAVFHPEYRAELKKLYVRYRYQKINKGQHILDIYMSGVAYSTTEPVISFKERCR